VWLALKMSQIANADSEIQAINLYLHSTFLIMFELNLLYLKFGMIIESSTKYNAIFLLLGDRIDESYFPYDLWFHKAFLMLSITVWQCCPTEFAKCNQIHYAISLELEGSYGPKLRFPCHMINFKSIVILSG
jgi:hypothetical protein